MLPRQFFVEKTGVQILAPVCRFLTNPGVADGVADVMIKPNLPLSVFS